MPRIGIVVEVHAKSDMNQTDAQGRNTDGSAQVDVVTSVPVNQLVCAVLKFEMDAVARNRCVQARSGGFRGDDFVGR